MEGSIYRTILQNCENCVSNLSQEEPHLLLSSVEKLSQDIEDLSLIFENETPERRELSQALSQILQQLRTAAEESLVTINERRAEPLSADPETAIQLRSLGAPWSKIGRLFGISRNSMYKFRKRHNIFEPKREMTDDELFAFISDRVIRQPNTGVTMMHAAVRTAGFRVSRKRVWLCLRRVDPVGIAYRLQRSIRRRSYNVTNANGLWSMDSTHKLNMYKIVIHGCIDVMSRKILYVEAANDNKSKTVGEMFKKTVAAYGLPKRVRSDKGGENVLVERFMRKHSSSPNPFIKGPSTRNQRIERLWGDVNQQVTFVYKSIFEDLEDENVLRQKDHLDLFCLSYVFLPRIQEAVLEFQREWNEHDMDLLSNWCPDLVWSICMRRQGLYGRPFVPQEEEGSDSEEESDTEEATFILPEYDGEINLLEECELIVPNPLSDDGSYGQEHYRNLRAHLRPIFGLPVVEQSN